MMQPGQRRDSVVNLPCIFLCTTFLFTISACSCMTLSLLTDYWEVVSIDHQRVLAIARGTNATVQQITSRVSWVHTGSSQENSIYLVPLHGGVDSMCCDVTDNERDMLKEKGYPIPQCVSYLTLEETYLKSPWVSRMRNLAISCGLVSLILLGACALVGIFGLIQKQISAIMVTGVMFVLSALFSVFTLSFMYFKRLRPEGLATGTELDKGIPPSYFPARVYMSGWSVGLGWGGVGLCILTGILWLLLAKIMRLQVTTMTA